MPVGNKHGESAQRIFYPGFDGGLNLAVPAEVMPKNELKAAMNVMFDRSTGAMTTRGGLLWSGRFDAQIGQVVEVCTVAADVAVCAKVLVLLVHVAPAGPLLRRNACDLSPRRCLSLPPALA